jgi:lipoate-protein ligase A
MANRIQVVDFLDLTMPTPAQNLACDEALLNAVEANESAAILRFWESEKYFVVLGYGNKGAKEVNVAACQSHDLSILRRCSGGGAVLQGPGCLNYSLVLPIEEHGETGTITGANRLIMERHRCAVASLLGKPVQVQGYTDLTIEGLKFSGNAQRRTRRYFLFHGTFLLRLDVALMQQVLLPPSREPAYRNHRSHSAFMTQINISREALKSALCQEWNAHQAFGGIPQLGIDDLVEQKYSRAEWNLKF